MTVAETSQTPVNEEENLAFATSTVPDGPVQDSGQPGQTRGLNLLDTYSVQWDLLTVVREFFQNYYDSVPAAEFAEAITITVDRSLRTVTLSGPTEFHLEYLWRIGASSKTGEPDRYAGQFGEGFVVATLVIMRDYGVEVRASVGNEAVDFFFAPVRLGDKEVRGLCCRLRRIASPSNHLGNQVILANCSAEIMDAFETGKSLFRYDQNPTFGERLGKDEGKGIYVYRSKSRQGAIYYRRQRRAGYDSPFIFCCDHEISSIRRDRDRTELGSKDIRTIVQRCVKCLGGQAVRSLVVTDLRSLWKQGHSLLTALADRWYVVSHWNRLMKLKFPADYLARSDYHTDMQAEDLGLTLCCSALHAFGMETTSEWRERLARGRLRCATKKETRLLQVLIDTCEAILLKAPEPKNYMVFMPEDGSDHYEGRYQEGLVVLNQSVLRGDFSHALAVFIHECSHRYGCDGNRAFSDQLTDAIERISAKGALINNLDNLFCNLSSVADDCM